MKHSNIQYPQQSGLYSVKVKSGRGWSSFSTARFQISVGQSYHEGEKFKATMDWAAARFDKVIICVNDTLQRFNFMYRERLSEKEAFKISEAAGREWIERNIQFIRKIPTYELYRWEDWKAQPEYDFQYQAIIDLYNGKTDFRELLQLEIGQFWKRRREKEGVDNLKDFDGFKKHSQAYLLEETAAFFLMFKMHHAVDVYPGSTLLPCLLAERYVEGAKDRNLGSRSFTRIDFTKNDDQKSIKWA